MATDSINSKERKTLLRRNVCIVIIGTVLVLAFLYVYTKYQPIPLVLNSQIVSFTEPFDFAPAKTTYIIGDIFKMNTSTQKKDKEISISVPHTDSFVAGPREYGTWVWQSPDAMTDEYRDTVLNGAAQYGINTVYVTIDDYLAIHDMEEGPIKDKKKVDYSTSLEKFIKAAHTKGIEVDVEAGWKDWAKEFNTYKSEAIIDYAIEYNNTHTDKIRAVQFDVEPYLLPEYETNKSVVLTSFVAFVDRSTDRLAHSDLRFTIVIPHFYDSAQKWTPAVMHDGITTYTFDHLLRILDRKTNSSIILMSYRNFAEGDGGSIRISETEIKTASTSIHSTKIIVAQETGAVEPEYVTFNNTSRALYEKQINLIDQAFKIYPNFGGISVHYIDPFLEL